MSDKFSKERKDLNEKLDSLAAEVAKRDRAILSLENAKEGLQSQLKSKERDNEEMRGDLTLEKNNLNAKIEDIKAKYDKAMDELTQSRIEFEREKALKD